MRRAIVVVIVYLPKLIVTVRRAAKRLKPIDRASSPLSVMLLHLIIRANETRHSCHYSLPVEVKNDGM